MTHRFTFLISALLLSLSVFCQSNNLIYSRKIGKKRYEFTDHLGNVSAVISDIKSSTIIPGQPPTDFSVTIQDATKYYPYGMQVPYWLSPQNFTYLATLEDSTQAQEQANFSSSYNPAAIVGLFNHTPDSGASKSMRLNGGSAQQIIGLAKSLQVKRGDVVTLEVYAKYLELSPFKNARSTKIVSQILQALTGQLGITPAVDGGRPYSAFAELFDVNQLFFPREGDKEQVRGYLNFLLFDEHYMLVDMGFKLVTVGASTLDDMDHKRLSMKVEVDQPGYLYAYLSNESAIVSEVYFDDFKIEHSTTTLADDQSDYRFGFNTQEETDDLSGSGNHTTALYWEYDTRIAHRWNRDPKPNSSWSPYAVFLGNPILYNDILGDSIKEITEGSLRMFKEAWEKKMHSRGVTDEQRPYLFYGTIISTFGFDNVPLEDEIIDFFGSQLEDPIIKILLHPSGKEETTVFSRYHPKGDRPYRVKGKDFELSLTPEELGHFLFGFLYKGRETLRESFFKNPPSFEAPSALSSPNVNQLISEPLMSGMRYQLLAGYNFPKNPEKIKDWPHLERAYRFWMYGQTMHCPVENPTYLERLSYFWLNGECGWEDSPTSPNPYKNRNSKNLGH